MLKKVRRPVKKPVENEESQTSQINQEGRNDFMLSNDSTNLNTNVVPFLNDSSSTSKGLLCFNAVPTLYQEGWQKAIVLSVESTTPVSTKKGECNRIKVEFFLQDQQIHLIQNLLLINSPNSVIMQLVNACIQPNEDRNNFNLLNLVERQVYVRIQKKLSHGKTFYNVVEVKPLEANDLEEEEG